MTIVIIGPSSVRRNEGESTPTWGYGCPGFSLSLHLQSLCVLQSITQGAGYVNHDFRSIREAAKSATTRRGPHARLGLRLAYDLARGEDARLVVLRTVRRMDADLAAEQVAALQLIHDEPGEADGRVSARVVQSPSVVRRILLEARQGYDLPVVGASEEWILRNWLSVLLVKKHEPSPLSWLRRATRRVQGR
jgi:hypothetical protein